MTCISVYIRQLTLGVVHNWVAQLCWNVLNFVSFQHKLAHHRWLVSFSFGNDDLASHEFKKLKALLKDSHIQVLHFFLCFLIDDPLMFHERIIQACEQHLGWTMPLDSIEIMICVELKLFSVFTGGEGGLYLWFRALHFSVYSQTLSGCF